MFTWAAIALCAASGAAAQWNVAYTSGSAAPYAVTAFGTGGYLGINSATFYVSPDAGATWTEHQPTIDGFPLYGTWPDAHFFGTSNGILAGAFDLNDQYAILGTQDGGQTWQARWASTSGNWPRRYNAVHFPSAGVGYAVGTNGRITKTVNGGTTWTDLATPTTAELTSVHFFDVNHGVITGNGTLRRTANGGASWTQPLAVTGRHVLAAAGQVVVAVGPSVCHASYNAGSTWVTFSAPFTAADDVHVINSSTYIVIDSGTDQAYITHSSGQYWETAVLPLAGQLEAVHFLSPTQGCIAGEWDGDAMLLTTGVGWDAGMPVATIQATSTAACGSTTCTLQVQGTDPAWTVEWYRDGQVFASGTQAQATFTASSSPSGIEAHVSNGTHVSIIPWSATVAVGQPFTVDAGGDALLCSGTSTLLSVEAPTGASILWQPATGLSDPTSATPTVSGLNAEQTYTVTATLGACTASDEMTVHQQPLIPGPEWIPLITTEKHGLHCFVDAYNGFVGDNDVIYSTADGGLTWTPHAVPVDDDWPSGRICMLDAFHGYVNDAYALYQTTDGWATYTTLLNSDLISGNYNKRVYAKNSDTLVMYCEAAFSSDRVLRSTDGGLSWTLSSQTFPQLNEVAFLQGGVVLLLGGTGINNARIYRSMDAGLTWQNMTVPDEMDEILGVDVTPDGTVFAAGYGDIWRSTDQGLTWTRSYDTPGENETNNIVSISFQGPDTGFAVIHHRVLQTTNGGACWQLMQGGMDEWPCNLAHVDEQVTFLQHGPGIFDEVTLYRNHPPMPTLQFTLSGDTICAGIPPGVVNNSTGFATYAWSIDGTFHSNAIQPTLPVLTPGPHAILLTGTNGLNTLSLERTVFVEDFDVTPMLTLLEAPCWTGDTVHIQAVSPAPVLGHLWYELIGTDTLALSIGGPTLAVLPSAPHTYLALPISLSGCPGNFSNGITVSASDAVPIVFIPNGENEVCTWGEPTPTWYHSGQVGNDADISAYVWTLIPSGAGTLAPQDDSCLVTWSSTYTGSASLQCQGTDACGTGPTSTALIAVDRGLSITEQPTDIMVTEGDPFTLDVVLSDPAFADGAWYHDGDPVVAEANTYTVTAATLADAGAYYWSGHTSNMCGDLFSDTIRVDVLPATGIGDHAQTALMAWPDPFQGFLTVRVPPSASGSTLVLQDAAGRVVRSYRSGAGPQHALVLNTQGLAPGSYVITLVNGEGRRPYAHVVCTE